LNSTNSLSYTLITDGPFDAALRPIRTLIHPPRGLEEKLLIAIDYYPCDILFIHRDAERQTRADRVREIQHALSIVSKHLDPPPHVCVVPVRMTEAWLLCDEQAIRTAAGNSRGCRSLNLPPLHSLEKLPNPKSVLYETIRAASELRGRRLSRLPAAEYAVRVAELIEDFSPLRHLSAFRQLEEEVIQMISEYGWNRQKSI
jgi:hypothetical protein